RNAADAPRAGHDGPGDRRSHREDTGVGPSQFASRHEAVEATDARDIPEEHAMSERMTDDYLWDRSGEPDETLRHLESVLGEYRHTGTAAPPDQAAQHDDLLSEDSGR